MKFVEWLRKGGPVPVRDSTARYVGAFVCFVVSIGCFCLIPYVTGDVYVQAGFPGGGVLLFCGMLCQLSTANKMRNAGK